MDVSSLMRLIFLDKNELTMGVLLVLFLVVIGVLLLRTAQSETGASSGTLGAAGDLEAVVESALKKTLGDTEGLKALSKAQLGSLKVSGGLGEGGPPETKQLADALAEREATIAALQADIAVMQRQVEESKEKTDAALAAGTGSDSGAVSGAGEVGSGSSDSDRAALEAKLAELQAKLAEYEIIEDDIADLSQFKEENRRLKEELEALKKSGAAPSEQPVAKADAPVATAAPSPSPEAKPSLIQEDEAAPLKFEKSTKFELDPQDDVMKEFASALGGGASPAQNADSGDSLITSSETPVADPQAAIDALLRGAEAESAKPSESGPVESAEVQVAADEVTTPASTEPEVVKAEATDSEAPASEGAPSQAGDSVDESSALDSAIDTEKLLTEVQSLGVSGESDDAGLEASIDTDKLLTEMQTSEARAEGDDSGTQSDSVTVNETGTQAASSAEPVDDVLAEFTDENFGKDVGEKASG